MCTLHPSKITKRQSPTYRYIFPFCNKYIQKTKPMHCMNTNSRLHQQTIGSPIGRILSKSIFLVKQITVF